MRLPMAGAALGSRFLHAARRKWVEEGGCPRLVAVRFVVTNRVRPRWSLALKVEFCFGDGVLFSLWSFVSGQGFCFRGHLFVSVCVLVLGAREGLGDDQLGEVHL
jgi:hypothetical protein